MIYSGIMSSGSSIYSYLSMGLFIYKLAMYEKMNLIYFVDNTLLKTSLAVMRSAVGVVTSPGKMVKSPPTVAA